MSGPLMHSTLRTQAQIILTTEFVIRRVESFSLPLHPPDGEVGEPDAGAEEDAVDDVDGDEQFEGSLCVRPVLHDEVVETHSLVHHDRDQEEARRDPHHVLQAFVRGNHGLGRKGRW